MSRIAHQVCCTYATTPRMLAVVTANNHGMALNEFARWQQQQADSTAGRLVPPPKHLTPVAGSSTQKVARVPGQPASARTCSGHHCASVCVSCTHTTARTSRAGTRAGCLICTCGQDCIDHEMMSHASQDLDSSRADARIDHRKVDWLPRPQHGIHLNRPCSRQCSCSAYA